MATATGASLSRFTSSLNVFHLARHLFAHRGLIRQFVRREIDARYRGSLLGLLWSFLNPILLLSIYTLVFGVVFHARWPHAKSDRLSEFAVTLFCGMIVLNLFGESVGRAPGIIVGAANYVKKVVFPLEILPVVTLGCALFHALVSLSVLLAANLLVNGVFRWTLVLVPVVALPLLMLTLGLSWFLASLGVFIRDLSHVVALILHVLMFATPVFYPMEALPEAFRSFLYLNPLTAVVEDLRRVVLWGLLPDWPRLLVWIAVDGAVMVLGYAWFATTRRAFADVL
jgi:lipopolysaccharide transport system permease protein